MYKLLSYLYSFIESTVLSLALFTMIYIFLFRPTEVIGASMQPNLDTGQKLITETVSYKVSEPQRGDIVVIRSPEDPQVWLIKRLIGLPSETVEISGGKFLINGAELKEGYLDQLFVSSGRFLVENETYTLLEDEYFVMGDNRNNSSDSRSFGPVKKDNIIGKAVFRFWPPQDVGILASPVYN